MFRLLMPSLSARKDLIEGLMLEGVAKVCLTLPSSRKDKNTRKDTRQCKVLKQDAAAMSAHTYFSGLECQI